MTEAAIALGSNLGDRTGFLAAALRALGSRADCSVRIVSSAYRTRPWGKTDQGEFINLCALIDTSLAPHDLLAAVKGIEKSLGRTATERWGPREIDIDLLAMTDVVLETKALSLPHPRMADRLFVMMPLAEIAPDLEFNGQRVAARADALRATAKPHDCVLDAAATAHLRASMDEA
jgi:2-amino-4-hydroxy-6-hydroxymethyldihydropteridine diphosphokinase